MSPLTSISNNSIGLSSLAFSILVLTKTWDRIKINEIKKTFMCVNKWILSWNVCAANIHAKQLQCGAQNAAAWKKRIENWAQINMQRGVLFRTMLMFFSVKMNEIIYFSMRQTHLCFICFSSQNCKPNKNYDKRKKIKINRTNTKPTPKTVSTTEP